MQKIAFDFFKIIHLQCWQYNPCESPSYRKLPSVHLSDKSAFPQLCLDSKVPCSWGNFLKLRSIWRETKGKSISLKTLWLLQRVEKKETNSALRAANRCCRLRGKKRCLDHINPIYEPGVKWKCFQLFCWSSVPRQISHDRAAPIS